MSPPVLLGAVLLGSLGVSLITDLRERRIPNLVTLPAFALALAIRACMGLDGLASGLAGAAIAFVPFFLLAWRGAMGMGDVKLVAAVGACVGGERIVPVLLGISLVGGLQGLLALLWTGLFARAPHRTVRSTVPYGVAIALGTLAALAWGA